MARDSTVNIGINATNNASGPIDKVGASLRGLEGAAGAVNGGLSGLSTAIGIGALATLAVQAGGAVVEFSRLAAASQSVGASFDGLAGKAGAVPAALLNSLKQASAGTISEYNLMLAANKAMLLGVADSSEEMGALMAIARSRGQAMGLSVTQAFNDLVTGLGRASPLILDNLGITVDLERVNAEYATSIGKTSAALTEQERKQALVNSVMREAAGIQMPNVDSMASSFERAQASIADMKVALGELFGPAIAKIADTIADAVAGVNDALRTDASEQLVIDFEKADARLQRLKDTALAYTTAMANAPAGMLEEITRLEAAGATWDMLTGETQAYFILLQDVKAAQADYTAQLETSLAATSRYYSEIAQRQTELMAGGGINLLGGSEVLAAQVAEQQAAIGRLNQSMAEVAVTQQIWTIALEASHGDAQLAAGLADQLRAQYDVLTSTMSGATGPMYSAADAMRILAANAADLAAISPAAAGGVSSVGQAAATAAGQFQRASNAAGNLSSALRGIAAAQAGLAALDNLGKAKDALKPSGLGGLAITPFRDLANEGGKAGAAIELIRYMSPPAASAVHGLGAAASTTNAEFSRLESTISSVLQGQLNPGVGVNVDDLLPREDAINENARRLADIAVNGFKGQDWLGEFAAEVPDIYKMLQESGDPKASAAQLLRDFQDGLVPELLDKEAAKERVRRMLLGQANMASLANEIASELSKEMGVSMAQAQAAVGQALGTATPAAGGGGAGAMDGAGQGGIFVDGLTKAIADKAAQLQSSGNTAGATWGTGFLATIEANVPQQLLTILTILVTPLVIAQINANNGRKGAKD